MEGVDPQPYVQYCDYVFLALYTLELVLKVIGMGFLLSKNAYLRDPWNVLDFVIVLTAYISVFSTSEVKLNVLRSIRVLRPLRTISGIQGMKTLMNALISSIPLLADTVLILLFFFLIFAIAGLQLWVGLLWKRCVRVEDGFLEEGVNNICGARPCPEGYVCVDYVSNPFYGVVTFDNIFSSLLVIFQSVTLEGWSVIMIMVQKGFNYFSFLFFIPLIFIGSFFLLNLTLVVINSKVI